MKRLKTIQDDQTAKKWDFRSNRPPKWPLWTANDPPWVISSIQNSLVRSVRTYPNIISWPAIQMKRLKTIQDDQMAKTWDFRSNRPQKWPLWTLTEPPWVISSIQDLLVRSVRTYPNIRSWSTVQMKGLKPIQDNQLRFLCNFWQYYPLKWSKWPPDVEVKTQKPMEMSAMVLILRMKLIDGVLTAIGAHISGAFHVTGDAENVNIWLFLGVLP